MATFLPYDYLGGLLKGLMIRLLASYNKKWLKKDLLVDDDVSSDAFSDRDTKLLECKDGDDYADISG